jgi:flagellar biogenesis protein FliO
MDTEFLLLLSLVLAVVLLQAAWAVRRVWRGRHP